jgi:hypothetical protein
MSKRTAQRIPVTSGTSPIPLIESFRSALTQVHAFQNIHARCGAALVVSQLCLDILPSYHVRPVVPSTKILGKLGPMLSHHLSGPSGSKVILMSSERMRKRSGQGFPSSTNNVMAPLVDGLGGDENSWACVGRCENSTKL